MIAFLKGKIEFFEDDFGVINVSGVGYLVYFNNRDRLTLQTNIEYGIFIETQVREDSISLFGFLNLEDKNIFNILKLVHGVSAKIAMAILGVYQANQIVYSILEEDKNIFKKVAGVGDKLANRIVLELTDKVKKFNNFANIKIPENKKNITLKENKIEDEALLALLSLGYSDNDSKKALMYVYNSFLDKNKTEYSVQEIIKEALFYFNNK
jgi:holliday junction DNA helicase RuvA